MGAELPLDPNLENSGAMLAGSIVHVRFVRKALSVCSSPHLLLWFESNGFQRHKRVAPLFTFAGTAPRFRIRKRGPSRSAENVNVPFSAAAP